MFFKKKQHYANGSGKVSHAGEQAPARGRLAARHNLSNKINNKELVWFNSIRRCRQTLASIKTFQSANGPKGRNPSTGIVLSN